MSKLKTKTLLYMLKEDDLDIRGYAQKHLQEQYEDQNAVRLIGKLIFDDKIDEKNYMNLLDCPKIDEQTAGDLIIWISEVRKSKNMPIEVIMEMYRNGDEFLKKASASCVVESYSMYVYNLIHKYYSTYATKYIDELYQSGVEGMLKAMDSYDENLGKFTTHAKNFILHELSRQINFHNNDITPHYFGIHKKLNDAVGQLNKKGMEVTEQRLKIATDIRPDIIRREADYNNRTNFRYLDDDADTSLQDIEDDYGMSPEKVVTQKEKIDCLNNSIDSLSENEKKVIKMKFWDKKTNEQIAKSLGIQVGDAKTLCNTALRNLRKDPNLRSIFSDYQTRAETVMRQCVVPVMPSEAQADMEIEDLTAIAEILNDESEELEEEDPFN